MYTVGRLAKRFGLSRSTLLYYDKIGLLHPSSHVRGAYRYYSESDAERLQRICMFRDAGLSLANIARAMDADTHLATGGTTSALSETSETSVATTLTGILEARLEELHREMMALRNQRTIIAALLGLETQLQATLLTKDVWTSLLSKAGFSEEDMHRWHVDFERTAPIQHANFLRVLGISETEVKAIRAWATAPIP